MFYAHPRAAVGARAEAATRKVQAWREKGELYLPGFPEEEIAALRGTIEYPPKGSPDKG